MTDAERTIDTEIHIGASIDVVWRALTDLKSYAAWNPYLFRIEGKTLAGETIRIHARSDVSADPMVQDISVISAAPYSMCWEGGLPDKSLFRGEHWFLLSESPPGKTHLRHYETFTGSMMSEILDQHGDTIKNNFHRMNEALRHYLEQ